MSGLIAGLQELIGKKIFRHEVEIDKTLLVRGAVTLKKGADLTPYDTGWINRTDWTNVHLGSDTTLNTDSYVTHNLNAPLSNLLVKVFISTDGTDANSFEVSRGSQYDYNNSSVQSYGYDLLQVDDNNILIQTGGNGLNYLSAAGLVTALDTENWYYKVKVWYIG